MSRIVVSGYYGSKNAGDEAMLAAMLEVLSDLDPKLHITVISADPEDTRQRHGVSAVSWLSLPDSRDQHQRKKYHCRPLAPECHSRQHEGWMADQQLLRTGTGIESLLQKGPEPKLQIGNRHS